MKSIDTLFFRNVFEDVQNTRSTWFIGSTTTRHSLVVLIPIKHSCSFFKHCLKFRANWKNLPNIPTVNNALSVQHETKMIINFISFLTFSINKRVVSVLTVDVVSVVMGQTARESIKMLKHLKSVLILCFLLFNCAIRGRYSFTKGQGYKAFSHNVTAAILYSKTKKRRPCWCTKLNHWELNFIFMQIFPFVVWN